MNATNLDTSEASKHVAADMLNQGEKDLRRFCKGTTPVERERHLDAYYWIVSNDYYSPFSFLNVCQLLGLEPWNKRDELLADVSRGAFEYRTRRSGYAARRFHISLSRLFSGELDSSAMESTSLLHVSKYESS